jgi:hypothetical protein
MRRPSDACYRSLVLRQPRPVLHLHHYWRPGLDGDLSLLLDILHDRSVKFSREHLADSYDRLHPEERMAGPGEAARAGLHQCHCCAYRTLHVRFLAIGKHWLTNVALRGLLDRTSTGSAIKLA